MKTIGKKMKTKGYVRSRHTTILFMKIRSFMGRHGCTRPKKEWPFLYAWYFF